MDIISTGHMKWKAILNFLCANIFSLLLASFCMSFIKGKLYSQLKQAR
jgi:hypothetical protein